MINPETVEKHHHSLIQSPMPFRPPRGMRCMKSLVLGPSDSHQNGAGQEAPNRNTRNRSIHNKNKSTHYNNEGGLVAGPKRSLWGIFVQLLD